MMIKRKLIRCLFMVFLFCSSAPIFGQGITRIYTDYNTYWDSQINNTVAPNTSHNLLGFSWNGNNYSTGVNDTKLAANAIGFSPQVFQAFPATSSPSPSSSTYIGVASNYGGGNGNISPVPVNNNLLSYITDGVQGLDIGTAIFNFPSSTQIQYQISDINPASIGDGIPDIIFTQVGQVSDANDNYSFTNMANTVVGNAVNINFSSSIPAMANGAYKFYSPANPTPTYQAGLYGTRPLRMMAFDWSDFGITASNATTVRYFIQKFSGVSDIAFTAYNKASMGVMQSISGTVFNDNNGGIPDGNGYAGATVRLYNSSNVLVNTVTTASNGVFIFSNVFPGNYRIELQIPAGFTIVGATDNNTDNQINVTLNDVAIQNQNFGINQPPTANNDIQSGEKNTPITINLTTNDADPNAGAVAPSSISLLPPTGATSIVVVGGNVKGFSVTGSGTWAVNNSGVFTFTPQIGFTGSVPLTGYTIYDTAGLQSNVANIILTIFKHCTKPQTSGIGTPTKMGISTQKIKLPQWPENIPNGFVALESNQKGLVITRIQNSSLITDPKDGMIIYDIGATCVKLYSNSAWRCITRDCNE